MPSIREQVRRNAVALISLVLAVASLGYNTWRNETTEHQRNVRHASFEVLERLGTLQEVVDARHYYLPYDSAPGGEGETRLRGFGSVALVRDLMNLMPAPGPETGAMLHEQWVAQFGALDDLDAAGQPTAEASEAERQLTAAINDARGAVVDILKGLE